MILPIVSYGNPVLKTLAKEIGPDYPGLQKLLADMFETMYSASGVGLAAPQVNLPIRLFIVDASPFGDEEAAAEGYKRVFINAEITERRGEPELFEEGCLSFPGIREDIARPTEITIQYVDENFQPQEEKLDGIRARIVQHEYDHIEGLLMTDHMSNLKKIVLRRRLKELTLGQVKAGYKMLFPPIKKF